MCQHTMYTYYKKHVHVSVYIIHVSLCVYEMYYKNEVLEYVYVCMHVCPRGSASVYHIYVHTCIAMYML